MSVNDLSAVLWRERELLELLTFKLEEEQLLLAAGRSRWISHASREVVAAAPSGPCGEILASHLAAMLELTTRIGSLRDENDRFLRIAAQATQETLAGTVTDADTYDASGSSGTATDGARLFDGSL